MRTQNDHDKGEWLVPRTVRCNKAIDVDKATKDTQSKSYQLDA